MGYEHMGEAETSLFSSAAGRQLLQSVWKPEGQPRAILQIVHGMAEHIACYDEMAKRLNREGILVAGHNHPGHGEQAEVLGWFGKGGFDALVNDTHTLRRILENAYPGVPVFLFGHSMGSFVVRNYCLKYEQGLAGVILSATGHFTPSLLAPGLLIANLFCALGAEKKPAMLLEAMSFAGYNKEWSPARTPKDWVSRNEEKVDRYVADPLCGFPFTNGGYRDMFRGLVNLYPGKLGTMEKNVPVLLYSGERDPLGGRGKGVRKVTEEIRAAGVLDVTMKLYEGCRHEMHNEPNREEVFLDLLRWLEARLNRQ